MHIETASLEFHDALPWVPEQPFFAENQVAIGDIVMQLQQDFPDHAPAAAFESVTDEPTPASMAWMWSHLMGQHHGSSEGWQGKVPLVAALEPKYQTAVDQLHYGPYDFTKPVPANPELTYDSLELGGFPHEIVPRYQASHGMDPRRGNVGTSILMVGQRLRWRNAYGERSVQEIYDVVAQASGADIDELMQRSPWMQAEARKQQRENDDWSGPYATELEIGRLCTEAFFRDLIDWDNYAVSITEDPNANEQTYEFQGETRIVPPRSESVITYHLKNGTKAHVLNAAAVARTRGVPRPTSDSQAREIVELGLINPHADRVSVAVSPPHIRAGIDIFVRLFQAGQRFEHTEIVSHPWLPDKELVTALGEIPATHKADMRMRALLAGEDPDSPALQAL